MNVLVAIDSFKESLTSFDAGCAVKEGITEAIPSANVKVTSIADGGEGTVSALLALDGAKPVDIEVTGPLFNKVTARYCILTENNTAVIEASAAAGLGLVPREKRNPLYTTTYGIGEMIKDAVNKGCRSFIIGIGGSATNDGGIGMLGALGYSFTDMDGKPVKLCGAGLEDLKNISSENVLPLLSECDFKIACDVKNPLCGENGCSYIFAPQKGAKPEEIEKMDKWLKNYSEIAGGDFADYKGAGAAGGLGFAFKTFLNATLGSGIDIILDEIGLENDARWADIVITGEGRLDAQTVMGKAPAGVAKIAKKYGKTVLAFSGCIGNGARACNENGIDAYFPILRKITTVEEALLFENAYENLKNTAYQVFRLISHLNK